MENNNPQISAFVVSYNREDSIRACLSSLGFADEIILVDKSSTDATIKRAEGLCDKISIVPWSPTVEETRNHALNLCAHDWVAFLDDDEIFNVNAAEFITNPENTRTPKVYGIPRKEYIMGTHSVNAYYWPNWQIRFFHRSLMKFTNKIHEGQILSCDAINIDLNIGARVEHLSHVNVSQFVEKTNRYTSQEDRFSYSNGTESLADFAHAAVDRWISKSSTTEKRSYEEAVAVLMATYEIIDALKVWESNRGLDGKAEFLKVCNAFLGHELKRPKQRETTILSKATPDTQKNLGNPVNQIQSNAQNLLAKIKRKLQL